MRRYFILASLLLAALASARGQDLQDIIAFSQLDGASNPRSVALGNALGAIGGDYSSLAENPAGLGIYRSGEIGLSASLLIANTRTSMLGNPSSRTSLGFGLDGVGFVYPFAIGDGTKTDGLLSINFAIGYNTRNRFHQGYLASAQTGDANTLADGLAALGNRFGVVPADLIPTNSYDPYEYHNWYLVAGYNAYGLWDDADYDKNAEGGWDMTLFKGLTSPWGGVGDVPILQKRVRMRTGGMGEYDLSMAFNFSNRYYLGFTLGIASLDRRTEDIFYEQAQYPTTTDGIQSIQYTMENRESGAGVNFKLGFIARPTDHLRIGLALHTPTLLAVKTTYKLSAVAKYSKPDYANLPYEPDNELNTAESPAVTDNFSIRTPLVAQGSLAYTFAQWGFLSVDYQFALTPMARFQDNDRFGADNELLATATKSTHEIRAGAEGSIGPISLRVGAGYRTTPYNGSKLWAPYGSRLYASAGVGFAMGGFYLDFAYRHLWQRGDEAIYSYEGFERSATHLYQLGTVMVGLGYRF